MNEQRILEELLALLEADGVSIRSEPLGGSGGGLCTVKGERIFFVDTQDFDWQTFGAEVEIDIRFPEFTNVEFAIVKSRKRVVHWSWERGAGPTRASGTGAASAVAVGIINGILDHQVTATEPAGNLQVKIPKLSSTITLTGPSQLIGEGVFVL